MHIPRECGEDGAEVEKLVLNANQYRGERRENRLGPGADAGEAGESIQFVYGPVAFNPRGILRDPLSARQSGLALVAGAGIDSIQRQARLIKLAIVHTTILETPRVPGARVTLS